jgi:hypothetical protein
MTDFIEAEGLLPTEEIAAIRANMVEFGAGDYRPGDVGRRRFGRRIGAANRPDFPTLSLQKDAESPTGFACFSLLNLV